MRQLYEGIMENLLTTKEAAKRLGVSEAFLERDRWAGARIPFIKVGLRAVRYDPAVITKYLKQQTRTSTSDSGVTA
jgi:excisionase family DNA binding protein